MRRFRWFSLLALALILLNQETSMAALIPISQEQSTEVTSSNAKIAALESVTSPIIQSDLSPDGKSLLLFLNTPQGPQLVFLNSQDGTTTPALVEGGFPPAPITSPVWLNPDTLIYLSSSGDTPILVSINSNSGKGTAKKVGLPGFPVSMAPNGSKVLLVAPNSGDTPASLEGSTGETVFRPLSNPLVSPFTEVVHRSFKPAINGWGEDKNVSTLQFAAPSLVLLNLDLTTGKLSPLYSLPEGTGLVGVKWTPDGSKVAVVRKTIPEIGRDGNYLSDKATQDGLGQLPPEQNPFFINDTIDLVDFNVNSIRPAALKAAGGNGDGFTGGFSWATDGQTFLVQMLVPSRLAGRPYPSYNFNQSTYHRYYSADGQLLYSFDSEETNTAFFSYPNFVAPDEVITLAKRGTNQSLYYHNKATGEFRKLPVPDGSITNFSANERTRQVIFTYSSFLQAPEVFRINWDGSGLTQLTFNNSKLQELAKVRVDPVDFTLSAGQKRSGYIIQAAGAEFPPKNVPLVMWQDGGPFGDAYANNFGTSVESPFNLLPQFGMAVLFIPFPGRDGFGATFQNALYDNNNFGQLDIDEAAEVMEQAISRGYTSKSKTGITGCSYGGYFTSQSISRHPDLYAAANTQCTLMDFYNEWQFGFTPLVSFIEGRTPTTDPVEYTRDSPFYNAYRIKTPLLIFDGTRDFLPYRISVNLHDQVAANGTATNMMLFDQEGHGLRSPHSELIAGQAQVEWFRQYLGIS